MFRTWLRRFAPRNATRIKRGRHTDSRPKPYRRLHLESLEDRLAPATHTWTGAASGSWMNNSNWNNGSPSGDFNAVLIFPGGTMNLTNTNDITTGFAVQSITFSGNSSYTISGNAITLNGGGIMLDNTVTAGTDAINLNITLGLAQLWTVTNANTTLAVGGVVDGTAGASLTKAGLGILALTGNNTYQGGTTLSAGVLSVGTNTALGTALMDLSGGTIQSSAGVTLANSFQVSGAATVDGSNPITFSSPGTLTAMLTITNTGATSFSGILGGAGALTVSAGTGTVTLTGANTYAGGTSLNSGTLSVSNGMALGMNTLDFSGGTLVSSAPVALANTVTVGTMPGTPTIGGSNNLTFTGNVTLLNPTTLLTITNTGITTFSVTVDGMGGLTEAAGAGTVVLSAANSYAGTTTLTSGTLVVGNGMALGTGTLALNGGNIQSNGALALNNTFTVGGMATVDGGNDITFAGAGTLNAGNTLTVTNTATTVFSGVLSGAGNLTNAGAGTLILSGANTYTGATTINAGTLQLGASNAVPSTSAVTVAGSATFLLNGFDDAIGSLAGSGNVLLGTGTLTIGGDNTSTTFTGVISGVGNVAKTGTGTLTLVGANTYTGMTTLTAGTLVVGSNMALGTTGTLNLNGGIIQANGAITLPNPFTVGGSAMIATGSATSMLTFIGAGTLGPGSALTLTNSPGTVTLAGNLSGNGSLFMNATGTLAVNGANNSTFSGLVQLTSGTLSVGSNNALGTGALNLNGGTILSSGAFSLGNNFTVGGAVTVGGSNNLTFTGTGTAAAANTVTVGNKGTTTFSGVLSGPLAITEAAGTGNLVLTSANTYTGATTLTSGTLTVGNDTALGTGSLALGGGTIQASAAVMPGNAFTVGGPVTVGGTNNLTFTGAGTLASGATVTVGNTATTTFSGVLSGAGGLTEAAGPGTLVLSGANTYTGATVVNNGTLQVGANNAIPSASAVTVAMGATLNLNNFNDTIGSLAGAGTVVLGSGTLTSGNDNTSTTFSGVISGTGGLTKSGTGTLTLTGNNTYTGATTVAAGTLLVNGSQPGSNVTVNSGATLGGSGTVGTITATGKVGPGGPGTAILRSGNVVFNAGSTFAVKLNGTTVGTSYDQLNATGSINLSAGPTLQVTVGFVPNVGDTFMIITSTSGVTGTFNGLPDNSTITVNGLVFRVNYGANTASLTRTIAQTTTVVTSSANPSVFGQPVVFNATVSPVAPATGTPTGTVTFRDGANVLGTGTLNNGVATFTTTTALTLGAHSITAVYNGDSSFAGSTSMTLTQTVNQAATTTTVTSSMNPSSAGQSVTFTATVSATAPGMGTPTGTVTFRDGTTVLGTGTLDSSGRTTVTTSALSLGTHSITAAYGGDTNFTMSTSPPLTQAVLMATTTTITTTTNPTVFGQPVIYTVTVAPVPPATGTPTGTVTFRDGTTVIGTGTLSGGTTTFTTLTLSAGTHSITATYNSDSTFGPSTSAILTQTVNQAGTTTALTSSANPSPPGQGLTFTATVTAMSPGSGTPTGTVTFLDGTTTLGTGSLDTTGHATIQTSGLTQGTHTITATYNGDANFTTSTSPALTQAIASLTTTVLTSSPNPAVFGQPITFTATVSPVSPATGTPTGTVTFMDGTTTLGTASLNPSGVATFTTTTLSTSAHSITATYNGDGTFGTSTSAAIAQMVNRASTTTTLSSSVNPSTSGQAVTFTAVVAATAPGGGTPTGTVSFRDGTTVLGTGTLDATGRATFQTSTLTVAAHQITAVYNSDANFATSSSTALTQTVNSATPTGTPSQKFVIQVFRDVLGRDPEQAALTHFSSLLDQNQATRTQVAMTIESSQEARTRQVQTLYQMLLGRQADSVGLDLATRFLGMGGSLFKLEAVIVGSPEYFQNRAGGTNNGFLTAVYRDALGRAVDSVGQSLGSQALASGIDRSRLAEVVFSSPEGLQDLVQSFYSRFLHRAADTVGLNASTAALQSRLQQEQQQSDEESLEEQEEGEQPAPAPVGANVDQVMSVIIGSAEYFGRL